MHLVVEALGNRDHGGATVLLDFLAAGTADSSFSKITVLTTPAERRSYPLPQSAVLRELPLPVADRSLAYRAGWLALRFERFVDALGGDVVLSLNGMGNVGDQPSAVLIQQPMPFYPEAVASFDFRMRFRFRVIRLMMARACRSADLVFVQTETMRRRVSEEFRLDPSKVSVHTPAVSHQRDFAMSDEIAVAMTKTPADRRLLYVGSDQPHKNLPILKAGLELVRAQMPDAVLFVTLPIGHPIGRIEGIECLGMLSVREVRTAYRLAAVVCQASLAETAGLPMLEAMSAGTPVLAADRPYALDICRDAALFFDPTDASSFARNAIFVLSDQPLREKMRERGYAIAQGRHREDPYGEMTRLLATLGRTAMDDGSRGAS